MRPILIVLALAPAFLAGCSTYAPPTLEFAQPRLVDESPDGFVLAFELDATNANEVELPLRDVRYTVALDGRTYRGVRSGEASLRRLGTQRLVIPAAFPLSEGQARPAGPVRYRVEGELRYVTPGEIAQILFDTGVRRPTVTFRHEGTIDLGAAP